MNIDVMKPFPVNIEIPVKWGEMDAFQHLNNVIYYRYFESARIAYFGKTDMMVEMEKTGIGPILASSSCRYKAQVTFPDTLICGSRVSQIDEDRLTMAYAAYSKKLGRIAAEGEAVIVSFNFKDNHKVPVPQNWIDHITALEKTTLTNRK